MSAVVIHNDIVSALVDVPDNTYDAVLCDPPYGLSFMGKRWDYAVPDAALWAAVLRVCKPGAALIAFSGTRTYHRTVVQIEDAGWEIRDQIAWMYGSGFPKSLDVSKAIDAAAGAVREVVGRRDTAVGNGGSGNNFLSENSRQRLVDVTSAASAASAAWTGYGTALKPAYEPAVLARKPLDGTVAANVERWGTGAIAIDASRVGYVDEADQAAAAAAAQRLCHDQNAGRTAYGEFSNGPASLQPYLDKQHMGRWPANVILDAVAGSALDAQAGDRPGMSGGGVHRDGYGGGMFGAIDSTTTARGDSGGASRFFYCVQPCEGDRCEIASTVSSRSSQRRQPVASALSGAATSEHLAAKRCDDSRGPSTSATLGPSKPSGDADTRPTRRTARKSSRASAQGSTSSSDLATCVAPQRPTVTTTTTASPSTSGSSVESATSPTIATNWGHGDRDFARFRYCAKASREERELGTHGLPHRSVAEMTGSQDGAARLDSPRTGAGRTGGARNHHPTVKPVDLMRYLARLIMPPSPGKLLVPFAGSGSEMIGALLAGWPDVTGIEREAEYVEIARARVALAASNPRAFEAECEKAAKADARQTDLFGRVGT